MTSDRNGAIGLTGSSCPYNFHRDRDHKRSSVLVVRAHPHHLWHAGYRCRCPRSRIRCYCRQSCCNPADSGVADLDSSRSNGVCLMCLTRAIRHVACSDYCVGTPYIGPLSQRIIISPVPPRSTTTLDLTQHSFSTSSTRSVSVGSEASSSAPGSFNGEECCACISLCPHTWPQCLSSAFNARTRAMARFDIRHALNAKSRGRLCSSYSMRYHGRNI